MNWAIIVAAGKGLRMGRSTPKQFLGLGNLPIVGHTLKAFLQCREIARYILVVPAEDFSFCKKKILAPLDCYDRVELIPGGALRQDSVHNGLQSIGGQDEDIVLIHDGVRPFVQQACIHACIKGAELYGACIAAIPAFDTLKKVKSNQITQTLPRDEIRMAQTPQAFRLSLIREAHTMARQKKIHGTDDAMLVEKSGHRVTIVDGDRYNIKITTPEDLEIAAALLNRRLNT